MGYLVARVWQRPFNPTSDAVVVYAAGLFDGEGYVNIRSLRRKGRSENVQRCFTSAAVIAVCNEESMRFLHDNIGGRLYKHDRKKAGWRQEWIWRISGKEAGEFFTAILPYSHIKRQEIEVAIKFIDTIQELRGCKSRLPDSVVTFRHECIDEIKRLRFSVN